MSEESLYRELLMTQRRVPGGSGSLHPITDYAHLMRDETWTQAWNPQSRCTESVHEVRGQVWSDAISHCLRRHGAAYIPWSAHPVYIDRPIVLNSGNRLTVHPDTEIRLRVGAVGTCMVRNANLVFSPDQPVSPHPGADTGIAIEGGIWSDQRNDGRGKGGSADADRTMPGSHGMFLLHNVAGIAVRGARFRDCSGFAIQLGNATDFVVEDVSFDETADGVHVEGPASHGIIRRVGGKTNDDAVALNAWDWEGSSMTFGPISDILVEDVALIPGYKWSELRLLPGTKVFPGGARADCHIRRCIFRGIRGVHTIKMYDQPNLDKPEEDHADPIGRMSELYFSDMTVDGIPRSRYYDKSSDAVFDICADVETLSIRNLRLNYTPGENETVPYLVSVGPKAMTWPRGKAPDAGWKEVFNPNANPVLESLTLRDIFLPDPANPGACVPCANPARLVHARRLTLNPDFPRSLPRGGTGCGRVDHVQCGTMRP